MAVPRQRYSTAVSSFIPRLKSASVVSKYARQLKNERFAIRNNNPITNNFLSFPHQTNNKTFPTAQTVACYLHPGKNNTQALLQYEHDVAVIATAWYAQEAARAEKVWLLRAVEELGMRFERLDIANDGDDEMSDSASGGEGEVVDDRMSDGAVAEEMVDSWA